MGVGLSHRERDILGKYIEMTICYRAYKKYGYTFIFNFITMRRQNFVFFLFLTIFMGLFTSCTKDTIDL